MRLTALEVSFGAAVISFLSLATSIATYRRNGARIKVQSGFRAVGDKIMLDVTVRNQGKANVRVEDIILAWAPIKSVSIGFDGNQEGPDLPYTIADDDGQAWTFDLDMIVGQGFEASSQYGMFKQIMRINRNTMWRPARLLNPGVAILQIADFILPWVTIELKNGNSKSEPIRQGIYKLRRELFQRAKLELVKIGGTGTTAVAVGPEELHEIGEGATTPQAAGEPPTTSGSPSGPGEGPR